MTVVFPEPMAALLRDAVEAEEFASTTAVRLREAWDAGKAGGRHGTLDFDDLRDEGLKRRAAKCD
jgi:antitoxin ParD1/3/4